MKSVTEILKTIFDSNMKTVLNADLMYLSDVSFPRNFKISQIPNPFPQKNVVATSSSTDKCTISSFSKQGGKHSFS